MTESQRDDFPTILRRSIQTGLVSIFGRSTAIAVEFYLDSSLAAKDIVAYTNALERMFKAGSKLIEERFAQYLYMDLGLKFETRDGYKLSDYVEEAEEKLGLGVATTQSADKSIS